MATQPQQQQAPEAPAAEQPKQQKKPIAFAKTGGLCPTDFADMFRLAEVIAASDLAPKDFKGKPANCLVAIQLGAEVGLSPMAAIQNIAVINGRPAIWGDAMLGLCRGSGLFIEADYDEHIDGTGDNMVAVCTVCRAGGKPQTTRFSVADAKKADLWGKDIWKKYPQRMLAMRARSWRLRDTFADVLKGLHETSEAEQLDAMLGQIDLSNLDDIKASLQSKPADVPPSGGGEKEETPPRPAPEAAPVDDFERDDLIAEIEAVGRVLPADVKRAAMKASGLKVTGWKDGPIEQIRALYDALTAAPAEPEPAAPVDDLALLQKEVAGHVSRIGTPAVDVLTKHGVFATKLAACVDAQKLESIRDELAVL